MHGIADGVCGWNFCLGKAGVFKKYRADILEILSVPKIMNANNDDRKRLIMSALAGIVYAKLPYAKDSAGKPIQNLGGGKVNLSTLDEGVCRHLAMTYQVLAQALGVSSRLFKNYESFGDGQGRYGSPEKHAANMVRVNGKWYILDATQPDWITLPNGTKQWRPGTLEIDRPPLKGQVRTYEGALKHSGRRKKYISNPESFYRIDKIS